MVHVHVTACFSNAEQMDSAALSELLWVCVWGGVHPQQRLNPPNDLRTHETRRPPRFTERNDLLSLWEPDGSKSSVFAESAP